MTNQNSLVLTQYPIQRDVSEELSRKIGGRPKFRVVSTLAIDGYFDLIRKLRSSNYDAVYVFVPDKTVQSLTLILMFLGLLVPARQRFIVSPDQQIHRSRTADYIQSSGKLSLSLFRSLFALALNWAHASYLMYRNPVRLNQSMRDKKQEVAYLRTNLWLGVQVGGAISHTRGVVDAFYNAGWHVKFCSVDEQGLGEKTNVSHISVLPDMPYIIPRELNHFQYHRTFLRSMLPVLENFKGILYQRTSIGNFVGVVLSRKLCSPLVIEYNGAENWLSKNWGNPYFFSSIIERIENAVLKHAHLIVTVSEPLREELVSRGVPDRKILVNPNGVEPERYDTRQFGSEELETFRSNLGIPSDGIVITFVGTFGPWHGAEVLASAALRISQMTNPSDVDKLHFLFIGDGVRRAQVEGLAGSLIEQGKVILTGLVSPDEIPKYLAASDIFASPTVVNPDKSPFFGSPTKLFEYMASGKPIIASDLGQLSDVMSCSPKAHELNENKWLTYQGGDSPAIGILTRPDHIGDLCDAILYLARRPQARARFGEMARQKVLENYTWNKHVHSIIDKLSEVVDDDAPGRLRILLNGLHSKSGGGVTYLRNLLPYLCADERLDVHVCLNEKQIPLFESWIGDATLHRVTLDDSLWRTILFEQFSLPKLARQIKADVTFSPANYGPLFAPRSVILLRNALSVAFVERRLSKILYWIMLYMGTLSSVFAAKNVISVSQYARKATVSGIFNWMPDKFHTIPHGISAIFKPEPSIEREENSLLFVSDIYVQKNLHGFFKSLSILKKRFPDIKLRVAGAPVDADYNERVHSLIKELSLEDAVVFLGNLAPEDLANEYCRATVFVFPSTVETFGNPLVEAMACGAPIACSNTAAMPEVADSAATYFDPFNVDDMARVIEELLLDKKRRDELSRQGIERAKIFSWQETARKTADVLIDAATV